MKFMRSVLSLMSRHPILSWILVLLLVFAWASTRYVMKRSEGIVSAPLKRGPIVESVYGIGTVMANRKYQIKVGVVSNISDLYVAEGDSVKKGQRLAMIDRILFQAPFAGYVTSLPFNVGENVFAQGPLLTLVDLADRYVVVSLEQQGALKVKKGQKAVLSFDTLREQTYTGTVWVVYPADSGFNARINIGKLPLNILPGMTCDVAIETDAHESALLVPAAALEDGQFVYVKRPHGIPSRVQVKTGFVDRAMVEVTEGDLKEGDQLIIRKKAAP